MAEHTILLTDEDEAALLFMTEQRNLMMPPSPMGTPGPPPMSPDDMLAQFVQMPLQSAKQQVAAVVMPLESVMRTLSGEAQDAALASITTPSTQMALRAKLGR